MHELYDRTVRYRKFMLELIFCFIEPIAKRMQIDSMVHDEQFNCMLLRAYILKKEKKTSTLNGSIWVTQ